MNQEVLEIIIKVLAKKVDDQERLIQIYYDRVKELEDMLAKVKQESNDIG